MKFSTQLTTVLILISSMATVEGQINIGLVNLINSIYFGIEAQTLVLINYQTDQQMYSIDDATWKKLDHPKILLTLQEGEELRTKFNSEILALIISDNLQWSQKQWQHLQTVIKRRSGTNFIFLTNNMNSTNNKSREEFLRLCYQKGLARVLLTSFEEPMIVYTIQPFPYVTVKTTSAALYLKERDKSLDCQGYPIRVSAGNNPPRAQVYYNKTGDIVYNGYFPRLLKIFAKRFNLTIEWVLMPNFAKGSALKDCIRYLENHQIDMCGDSLPLNESSFVIAKPLYISSMFLIVPFAQTIPKYRYFMQPFESRLWIFIIATISYITFGLSLINRLKFGFWEIGEYFLTSLQSFLYLSIQLPRWQGMRKLLPFAILTLAGFIISNLYVAFLSSILTTNVYESQIETLKDLKQRKITTIITAFDKEIFTLNGLFPHIADNYLIVDIPLYKQIRDSLDPRYAYISIDDKADYYLHQQKFLTRPLLYKVSPPISGIYVGIPMLANWPLESLLNQLMLTMFDTGLLKNIEERTREDGITLGNIKFLKTTYLEIQPLDVSYFQMPALLLAGGYLSAVLCFVVEKGLHFIKN